MSPGGGLRCRTGALRAFSARQVSLVESYRVLNPNGFFDNAFTEQLGFRMR